MMIDRYMLRLWLGPFAGGIIIVFSVLVLTRALKLMGTYIDNPEAWSLIADMLLLTIPTFLLQIIPVAFFLSLQYVVSSLQQSSEMDALRASGISYGRMFRIFFVTALLLWIGLSYSTMVLMPKAQLGFNNILTRIYAMQGTIGFSPQRFTQGLKGMTVYVDGEDENGTYHGVLLEDHRDAQAVIYVAESARFARAGERLQLEMHDGVRLEGENDDQRMLAFKRYQVSMPLPGMHRKLLKSSDHITMMTPAELWNALKSQPDAQASAEWNRRLLFPSTLLILLFFVLPLSLTPKRSGKTGAMISGILLLVGVFNLQLLLFQQVNQNLLPGWTMWLGQAGMLMLGIYLSWRATQDKQLQLLLWLSTIRWSFRRRAQRDTA